jgi:hypothetical protein
MSQDEAALAALVAYKEALAGGGDKDVALAVAMARFRATRPSASEYDVRSWLAFKLAEERVAERLAARPR